MNFDSKFADFRATFENYLKEFTENLKCEPKLLGESLAYSLNLGGKRIRPVLMFAAGGLCGVSAEKLKNFALALELIHTYSLIHDDLPEMDNDDFRRGKPSNHKVFGAGNAVLAGDGLLNTAYSLLFDECFNGKEYVSAAKYICECAGINGMIAGQSADLMHENDKTVDEKVLDFIYSNKTGKLIVAALCTPSILSGGKNFAELKAFGKNLGYLFQLTDDVLDVTGDFSSLGKSTGKDEKEGKYTSVRLYGLEKCKLRIDLIGDDCHKILDGVDGDVSFLHDFVNYIKNRIS